MVLEGVVLEDGGRFFRGREMRPGDVGGGVV